MPPARKLLSLLFLILMGTELTQVGASNAIFLPARRRSGRGTPRSRGACARAPPPGGWGGGRREGGGGWNPSPGQAGGTPRSRALPLPDEKFKGLPRAAIVLRDGVLGVRVLTPPPLHTPAVAQPSLWGFWNPQAWGTDGVGGFLGRGLGAVAAAVPGGRRVAARHSQRACLLRALSQHGTRPWWSMWSMFSILKCILEPQVWVEKEEGLCVDAGRPGTQLVGGSVPGSGCLGVTLKCPLPQCHALGWETGSPSHQSEASGCGHLGPSSPGRGRLLPLILPP